MHATTIPFWAVELAFKPFDKVFRAPAGASSIERCPGCMAPLRLRPDRTLRFVRDPISSFAASKKAVLERFDPLEGPKSLGDLWRMEKESEGLLRCRLSTHRWGWQVRLTVRARFLRAHVCKAEREVFDTSDAWRLEARASGWVNSDRVGMEFVREKVYEGLAHVQRAASAGDSEIRERHRHGALRAYDALIREIPDIPLSPDSSEELDTRIAVLRDAIASIPHNDRG